MQVYKFVGLLATGDSVEDILNQSRRIGYDAVEILVDLGDYK